MLNFISDAKSLGFVRGNYVFNRQLIPVRLCLFCLAVPIDVCNGTRTSNHFVRKGTLNHLNFRFRACFEQEVPWYSGNYSVWIHSETRTWHDKSIQLVIPIDITYKSISGFKLIPPWLPYQENRKESRSL